MKKLSIFLFLGFCQLFFAQNFEVSTLRIGDFKVFMPKTEADKIAKKALQTFEDYEKTNKVSLNGENVDVTLMDQWVDENKPMQKQVYSLKTKSPKFKTKSGMGVGNTRDQLIDTYRNYANFEVHQYKDENGKNDKQSFFTLNDYDAGTYLTFVMENNIVVEIMVGMNEGC